MATVYATQSGAGSQDGTSLSNAFALPSINWANLSDDTLIVDGTITSSITVGAHNSSTLLTIQGQNNCSFTNGLTITGNTNRNNLRIEDISFSNSGGNAVRLNSASGMENFYFLRCNFDDSNNGFSMQTGMGHSLTDITWDTCTFSNNTTYGRQMIFAGTSPGPATDFVLTNATTIDCTAHLNGKDCFRDTLEAGNQAATIDNYVFQRNYMYNNGFNGGGRGLRFGAATHLHNTGDGLICTDNVAIGNGVDYAGGGLDLRSGANNGGSIGDSDVTYIARNIACGNGGENGGINVYGVSNCLVEFNITNDQFVGEDNNPSSGPSVDPVIDGNGMILDANSDHVECRYNYASRNLGSSANNSGCGLMILYNVDELRVHHNYGYGNKTGLWSAHQGGQTQDDIECWNNTYRECVTWGYSHRGFTAEENKIRNNVFTGAAGALIGLHNNDSGANVDEDYSCYYNFATLTQGNGGVGSNSISTEPLFEASPTYTDDFTGTAATKLDVQDNITWTLDSADGAGVEGERVIEVDGSGAIYTSANGGGNTGIQTMYLAPQIESPLPGRMDWDHYVKMTIDSGWTGSVLNGIYGLMRYVDKDNCIVMRLFGTGAGGLVVRSRIGGTETTLLTAQPTAGSVYEMRAYTETIELFKDGVSQGTHRLLASDHDPLAAYYGLGAFQTQSGVQWSNFEAGVLNPGFVPAAGSPVLGDGETSVYQTDPDGEVHSSPPDMGAFVRPGTSTPTPTISSGEASSITAVGCTPRVTADNTGDGRMYMVIGPEGESFWKTDVLNGTLRDGTPALAAEDVAVSSTGVVTFSAVTSLESSTNYRISFVHEGANTETSTQEWVNFTTSAAPAPVLTSPTADSVAETTVEPKVTTDTDNGTAYMVLVPNGDSPSVAQIKLGQQSDSSAALANESLPVSAAGQVSFTTLSGLTASTSYELFFVHTNSEDTDSLSSTVGFTTDDAPTPPPPSGPLDPDERMAKRKRRRIRWRYKYGFLRRRRRKRKQ